MKGENSSVSTENSISATSNKSSFKETEDYLDTYIIIPSDGGWGWLVVVASFLCNFVADGAIYTFGIFLDDISITFNTLQTNVAVANSLMTGFYFTSGPITCAILNRCGFQLTGFLGGLISAAAFGFSTLTGSLSLFLVVFGVVGGFGFGMVYVPSVVVIGFYFEKWRALATSLAVTGSAAGIVGFPIIIDGILANFTWQFKFLVISGFCLLLSFLALFYRPLKPTRVLLNKDNKIVQILASHHGSDTSLGGSDLKQLATKKKPGIFTKIFKRFHNVTYPTHAQLCKDSTFMMYFTATPSSSSVFINSIVEDTTSSFVNMTGSKVLEGSRAIDGRSERFDKLSTIAEDRNEYENRCKACCKTFWSKVCCKYSFCKWCCGANAYNRPMYRDDIFFGGSLFTLTEYTQSKSSQLSKMKSLDYTMSVTRVERLKEKEKEEARFKCCNEPCIRTLVTMLHFQLLKSWAFVLLALSGFFTILGVYVPFIYLIERANEIDIDKHMSRHFYTALGVSNALGRFFSGVVSTIPQAKPLIVSYVSLIICGISTIVSYFCRDIYSQFSYCTVFGLTIAAFASLRTPIVVELLGLENLTNAFGLLLLFHGIAAFCGIPLAGKIVTMTNSFNASFIFSGSIIVLSGILLIPIKFISKRENQKPASS